MSNFILVLSSFYWIVAKNNNIIGTDELSFRKSYSPSVRLAMLLFFALLLY